MKSLEIYEIHGNMNFVNLTHYKDNIIIIHNYINILQNIHFISIAKHIRTTEHTHIPKKSVLLKTKVMQ